MPTEVDGSAVSLFLKRPGAILKGGEVQEIVASNHNSTSCIGMGGSDSWGINNVRVMSHGVESFPAKPCVACSSRADIL